MNNHLEDGSPCVYPLHCSLSAVLFSVLGFPLFPLLLGSLTFTELYFTVAAAALITMLQGEAGDVLMPVVLCDEFGVRTT